MRTTRSARSPLYERTNRAHERARSLSLSLNLATRPSRSPRTDMFKKPPVPNRRLPAASTPRHYDTTTHAYRRAPSRHRPPLLPESYSSHTNSPTITLPSSSSLLLGKVTNIIRPERLTTLVTIVPGTAYEKINEKIIPPPFQRRVQYSNVQTTRQRRKHGETES